MLKQKEVYLPVREAIAYTGKSLSTIRRLIKSECSKNDQKNTHVKQVNQRFILIE